MEIALASDRISPVMNRPALSAMISGARRFARRLAFPTNRLRTLPDFVIIGAAKCGTTSLFQYLNGHPQLILPREKEVHYFDSNYRSGEIAYRAHFPFISTIKRSHVIGRPIRTGEATPDYMFHPLVPQRAAELIPNAKLIVLLRNPVDRAFSHYQHVVRGGVETLSFEEAIRREPERLAGEVERMRSDESYRNSAHRHLSYVSRGIYVEQLLAWERWFPQNQILVLSSEDFYNNPVETLLSVENFIDIDEWTPPKFEVFNGGHYQPMNAQTRRELVNYFRPQNMRLYRHLGFEFKWDE